MLFSLRAAPAAAAAAAASVQFDPLAMLLNAAFHFSFPPKARLRVSVNES